MSEIPSANGNAYHRYMSVDEASRRIEQAASTRHDGWANLLTGMGLQSRDRVANTTFRGAPILDEVTLEELFSGDGIARRICSLPAREMTRHWFSVDGDPQDEIVGAMEVWGAKRHVTEALTWGRLHGGCLMVLGLLDGGRLDEPLNEEALEEIKFAHLFNRFRVGWEFEDVEGDPNTENYGKPFRYRITPFVTGPNISLPQFYVHHTRCLVFDGVLTPERMRQRGNNQGWGDSALRAPWYHLRNVSGVYNNAANIIEDFSQAVMEIENLEDLVASGQEDLVLRRMHLVDMARGIMNTIVTGKGETFDRKTTTVAGMGELIDRFQTALSAATGIPVTLLFGRSPAGLNATGESDIRLFYDAVAAEQQEYLRPKLERLVYLTVKSRKGPKKGVESQNWGIRFHPLWQMDDKELAEVRKLHAETDQINVNIGAYEGIDVAKSRYSKDRYGNEVKLDAKRIKELEMAPPEEEDALPSSSGNGEPPAAPESSEE